MGQFKEYSDSPTYIPTLYFLSIITLATIRCHSRNHGFPVFSIFLSALHHVLPKLGRQQFIHNTRVCLAASLLHHLPDEPAEHTFFTRTELLYLLGIVFD